MAADSRTNEMTKLRWMAAWSRRVDLPRGL